MSELKLDPEFAQAVEAYKDALKPRFEDIFALREYLNASMVHGYNALPYPEGVEGSNRMLQSLDGAEIRVVRFVPQSTKSNLTAQRAVVFAFGGGMIAGSVDISRNMIAGLAKDTSTQVFAVDYRTAPEHIAPAAVEDFYATIKWLQTNSQSFNVDPARIIAVGYSAGGCIAAGAALMARDKGLDPPLAAQLLHYPVLDDRTKVTEGDPLLEHLTWSVEANDIVWAAYTGKSRAERTELDISPYIAPARASSLTGLPATFIDVGGLDLFRNEDATFAARVACSNIQVEFRLYPGIPHAFEVLAPNLRVVQEVKANHINFITQF